MASARLPPRPAKISGGVKRLPSATSRSPKKTSGVLSVAGLNGAGK